MTAHATSDASEAQGSKNTDTPPQELWQKPAFQAGEAKAAAVEPQPREQLQETMRESRAAHENAAGQVFSPATGVLHLQECVHVERDHGQLALCARELAGLEALMDSEPCTACGGTGTDLYRVAWRCSHCDGEGWTLLVRERPTPGGGEGLCLPSARRPSSLPRTSRRSG